MNVENSCGAKYFLWKYDTCLGFFEELKVQKEQH